MISDKCAVFFFAMVLVCHVTYAADSVTVSAVNGTSNATLINKPAVPVVVPAVTSNNHLNANTSHLRVRRKGSGIGGAVAGGVASGAAMTMIGGLLGGRV